MRVLVFLLAAIVGGLTFVETRELRASEADAAEARVPL